MTHRALVVGLGQIGMGYDLRLKPETHVLTHARAFQQHPCFSLVGGVDSNAQTRSRFEAHYSAPSYASVENALRDLQPDIVAVATPTPVHAGTLREVLSGPPPHLVLCEKPLSFDTAEAREMLARCAERHVSLYVNYFRRSDPGVVEVRRRIAAGQIRPPLKGVVWYSKGLMHNGSHFLNLLQYWLGRPQGFQVLSAGRLFDGIDPEPDVRIRFERGEAVFLAACEENFSHYTIELLAQNGRLRCERGGERIVWQEAETDSVFTGYTTLNDTDAALPADMMRAQWHVVDRLAAGIASGRTEHLCTGAQALETLEFLNTIRATL